ncbi:MAG: MBL fold metallo-hydrolase [Gammaproteobacteria bacterium]|nr:MBL fold metallo-hydrolase [Gammaproteobacteria bacterium]
MYQSLPFQITVIDTGLMGSEVAACYLLESDGESAIIETGNYATAERVLNLLEQRQLSKEKVRFIIPTHVHLDHSGGASSLIDALPNAQLVIHPRGARHMIDPTKLIAGATAVYGEAKFHELYGNISPIDEDRLIIAEDCDTLTFGNRRLLFRNTPGHASHHFCIWDELSSGWFSGDTFGISYRQFLNENGSYLFPTTTPVQFDPEALITSIKLMMNYQPKKMYLTHFGAIDIKPSTATKLCIQIDDYVAMIDSQEESNITHKSIHSLLSDYTYQKMLEHGLAMSVEKFEKLMAMDLNLNTQGLIVWHERRKAGR